MQFSQTAVCLFCMLMFGASGLKYFGTPEDSDSVTFSNMARMKGERRNEYVIASVFEPKDIEDVIKRLTVTGPGVDWILTCIHGCDHLAVEEFIQAWLRGSWLGNSIEVLKPDNLYRDRYISKEATWWNLRKNYAETLTAKKAIWLVDTDIWFDSRFVGEYARVHEQFPVRPLITQPTIRQNTQDPRMKVNQNYWDMDSLKFAYSTFVEPQVVMMDPEFFLWLMDAHRELMGEEYKRRTDLSMDNVWCGLGTLYDHEFNAAGVSPCGVIALPVDHKDDHTDVTQKYRTVVEGGMNVYDTQALRKLWAPQERLNAKLSWNNPLKGQPCRVCCLHQCRGDEGGDDTIACCHKKMTCEALPEVCEEEPNAQILFPAYANASRA